jgi:hypothetical protein
MTIRINEVLLKKHCIEKHGETLGEVVFAHEMEKQRKTLDNYRGMLMERDALEIEITAFEATLPRLEPLEQAMSVANQVWIDACAALEDQRVRNVAAAGPLQAKLAHLRTQISFALSPPNEGKWALPSAEELARHEAQTIRPSMEDESITKLASNPALSRPPALIWADEARNWTTGWRR